MQAKHPAGHSSMMKSKDHMMMKGGGPVKGAGSGTSDSIPIMASDGEYMMPADSVKKIGVKVLDAMKNATHKPVKGMPRAGARKGPIRKMADGGLIEEERKRSAAPGNVFTFSVPSEVKAGVQRGLQSLRGPAPVGGAAPGFVDLVSARAADLTGGAVTPGAAVGQNPLDQRLAAGTQTAQPVGEPTAPAGGFGAGRGMVNPPLANPNGPGPSVDPNTTVSLAGKPGAPVAGAAGAFKLKTPDGRTLYSNVTGSDNDTLMSGQPGVQTAPGFGAAPPAVAGAPAPAMSSPALDAQLSAARNAAAARGDFQAVSDSYGGNFAGGAYAPKGNTLVDQIQRDMAAGKRLTPRGARALNEDQRAGGEASRGNEANRIAQGRLGVEQARLGVEQGKATLDSQSKAALMTAESAYLNAKPEDKAGALERLRALQGKYERETPDLFDRVQTGIDPATGAPVFSIYSKRTGQVQGPAGGPQAPAPGTVKNGYRFKGGNPADQKSWEKV